MADKAEKVGPVLRPGDVADAFIEALRRANPRLTVQDRGAYVRLEAPGRCTLSREAAEEALGRPLSFPGDLEKVMPAFKGRFTVTDKIADWRAP